MTRTTSNSDSQATRQQQQQQPEPELDPTLDFFAGTVAGVSGLVVGFPFDTGKEKKKSGPKTKQKG